MVLTSTLILAQRVETTGIMFNSILCISIFVLGTKVSHLLEILFRMGLKNIGLCFGIRAIKRFALFDLLKSLYSDTKILSKYIPSLQ